MYIVYFLQRADGDIKIGTSHTWRFHSRLRQLAKQHGELTLLGVVEGSRAKERELHMRFTAYRRHVIGRKWLFGKYASQKYWTEFFEPSEELLTFITEHTKSLRID